MCLIKSNESVALTKTFRPNMSVFSRNRRKKKKEERRKKKRSFLVARMGI